MHKYAVRLLKNKLYPLRIDDNIKLEIGQHVVIRTDKGEELAKVEKYHECSKKCWKGKEQESFPVVRLASKEDIKISEENVKLADEAYFHCLEFIKKHKLNMNLITARYTLDRKKLTFYYTAPSRVDFRELLKDLTQIFKRVRIDLRHIGVRDETSILEGVGLCGRQFCCCSWLDNFSSINVKLAKDQGLPINPSKISGTCGRLLCCLEYEYQNYMEAAVGMPPVGSGVMTPEGIGRVSALHFLNGQVQVKLEDGRVKEFVKKDIEMIDAEVEGIEIDTNVHYTDEEVAEIDISSLEDDEQSSTGNC